MAPESDPFFAELERLLKLSEQELLAECDYADAVEEEIARIRRMTPEEMAAACEEILRNNPWLRDGSDPPPSDPAPPSTWDDCPF